MYTVTCESVSGYAIRIHPNPDAVYGDPYIGGCVVVPDNDCAVVMMWLGKPSTSAAREFDATLWAMGFNRLRYMRMKGGKAVWVEREL